MAVERFPDSPDCLAWYAYGLFHWGHLLDIPDRVDWYKKGAEMADRALAIDPAHTFALSARIITSSWLGDFKSVDDANEALVAMDSPLHVRSGIYAVSLIFRGRFEEAVPYLNSAIELERGTPLLFYRYAILVLVHFMAKDFASALVAAENALTVSTEFFLAHLVCISALSRLGRYDDAKRAITDMLREFDDPRASHCHFIPITDSSCKADFLDALRSAGFPD